MTISYQGQVATSTFGCFWKLLLRWRGSLWRVIWKDLLLFAVMYAVISIVYRRALDDNQKRAYEKFAIYCDRYVDSIPMSFVLGFYVSTVVTRWWAQFTEVSWPDRIALYVTASVRGHDDRGRLMRRTMMRYVNLSGVMTTRSISPTVKKRFPTLQHLVDAGFMLPNEKMIIEGMATLTSFNIYFVPLVWCTALITRARKEGRIHDDYALKTLMDELNKIRGQYGSLFNYDWVPIPLVYTQVVTLAVYLFFIISLFCRQFLDPAQAYKGHEVDFYVPIFTVIQFLFYMGWLKVAETMVNPMGEDDDDFDLNWIIDRNIKVSYLIVDEMHAEHPELIKDQYWDEFMPELPYTAASEIYKTEAFMGSAFDVVVPSSEMDFLPTLEGIPEDQEDNERSVGYSLQINKGNTESSPVDIAPLAKMTSSGEITGVGSSSKRVNLFTKLKRQFTRQETRASTSSLQSRRKLSLPRSTSRFSHASTINSMPAVMKVDDNIFHMSDITLAEEDIGSSCGKSNSPHWQRLNSQKESSSLSEDACSLTHSSTHAEQLLASSNAIPSTKNHPTIVTTSGQERSNQLDKSASQETITDEKNKVSSQAGVTSVFIPRSKGSYSTLDNMDKDLGTELYGSSVHRSEGFLSKLMKKKRRRNSGSESSLSSQAAEETSFPPIVRKPAHDCKKTRPQL